MQSQMEKLILKEVVRSIVNSKYVDKHFKSPKSYITMLNFKAKII
jgi:hypothetical protein